MRGENLLFIKWNGTTTRMDSDSVRSLEQAGKILSRLDYASNLSSWHINIQLLHSYLENEVLSDRNTTNLYDTKLESEIKNGSDFRKKPIALLVEPRDEVFARIAYDIAEVGMRVIRAQTAGEAIKLFRISEPLLVVIFAKHLGRSGWLLVDQLLLVDPTIEYLGLSIMRRL